MKKYIIDYKKLEKGDIVLSSGSSKGAKVIMLGTKSDYSHAMIYVHHTLIHAIPEGGVYSKNPQRLIFDSLDDVKVLRLKKSIDPNKMDGICTFARNLTGTLYSKKEAINAKFYGNKDIAAKTNKQFCSRLVSQAYISEGIQIVNNPDYCSPEDINKSDLLEYVHGVVKIALPEEIAFAQTPDPGLENQRVTLEWLKKARDLAKDNNFEVQSVNDAASFLCKYPEFDNEICRYIIESGYLENYKADYSINPYRYDVMLFNRRLQETITPKAEVISLDFDKEPGFVGHFMKNLSINNGNVARTGLKYFELHNALFKNNLNMAKERLNILFLASAQFNPKLSSSIWSMIQEIDNAVP